MQKNRAVVVGKSMAYFKRASFLLPLGAGMAWKTLWRIPAWCSNSWTSCLPSGVVSTRRHAHSSCSCLTSLPSPIRSCCRVPVPAQWISRCRKVSGRCCSLKGAAVRTPSLAVTSLSTCPPKGLSRHPSPPSPQRNIVNKCHGSGESS